MGRGGGDTITQTSFECNVCTLDLHRFIHSLFLPYFWLLTRGNRPAVLDMGERGRRLSRMAPIFQQQHSRFPITTFTSHHSSSVTDAQHKTTEAEQQQADRTRFLSSRPSTRSPSFSVLFLSDTLFLLSISSSWPRPRPPYLLSLSLTLIRLSPDAASACTKRELANEWGKC